MKWNIEKKIWRYVNTEKKFMVEVHSWSRSGEAYWNKYLYLYPDHPDFAKYQPIEGAAYPETPYEFNGGVTYYNERYDKDGKMIMQEFGDDYSHVWDDENSVDSEGTRVFYDAEKLILILEA